MNNKEKLNKMNNEIKVYINESNFISNKCRNKVIKMLGDEFDIDFPLDNYKSIDVTILENGHIIMRDDEYIPSKEITSFEEIEERYNKFKEKTDLFLNKKEISFENKKIGNHILNLIIIIILFLVIIALLLIGIQALLLGDYFHLLWLILIASSTFIPKVSENLKDRLKSAQIFIKRLLKK